MKKKFWMVISKFFDSGRVKVNVVQIEAETKPENGMVENQMCDEYRDYFDSYKEAKKFADETEKA